MPDPQNNPWKGLCISFDVPGLDNTHGPVESNLRTYLGPTENIFGDTEGRSGAKQSIHLQSLRVNSGPIRANSRHHQEQIWAHKEKKIHK